MRVKNVGPEGFVYSDTMPCNIGTPQGSVLGPLIFLLFNNDLHLHLSYSNSILFADDTTICATHKDIRHLTWCIQEDLKTLSDWFKANKLTLNVSKSVCMLFSRKNKKTWEYEFPGLTIDNAVLHKVSITKFLGVYIDENLSWTEHYNKVISKMRRNLVLLKNGKNLLSLHAKKLLYYGHIF